MGRVIGVTLLFDQTPCRSGWPSGVRGTFQVVAGCRRARGAAPVARGWRLSRLGRERYASGDADRHETRKELSHRNLLKVVEPSVPQADPASSDLAAPVAQRSVAGAMLDEAAEGRACRLRLSQLQVQEVRMTMPRKLWRAASGAALLAAIAATPVVAHHAFSAEFDATARSSCRDAITKVELVNPHAWIHMEVKKPDGKIEEWMVEGGTPNTLQRRGITRDTIKVGTVIIVDGFQSKDGTLKANGRNMTFPDGRTLFMGSSGTGAPRTAATRPRSTDSRPAQAAADIGQLRAVPRHSSAHADARLRARSAA